MKSSVVAIIVTYNRKTKLKKCIDSILNQSIPTDILVVNNNSSDGTHEYLSSMRDDGGIHIVNCSRNYGGAGGFNIGMKEAYNKGYDYFWLMDDDAYPKQNALEALLDADDRLCGEYGFLYSSVVWNDGQICYMNTPKYRHFCNRNQSGYRELVQASFVSFFVARVVVKKVGFPIMDFFIWGDDVEYSRRIAVRNKLKCYLIDESVITHDTKNNVGSSIAFDSNERINRYYYAYRNEMFLYSIEGFSGLLYFIFKVMWNVIKILVKADNKKERLRVLLRAIKDGVRFKPLIERPDD